MIKIPFGKHKGKTIDQVPENYLLWILDQPGPSRILKMEIMGFLGVELNRFYIDKDFASQVVGLELRELKALYLNNPEACELLDQVKVKIDRWLVGIETTEKRHLELVS